MTCSQPSSCLHPAGSHSTYTGSGQGPAHQDTTVGLHMPGTNEMLLDQHPRPTKPTEGSRMQCPQVLSAPGSCFSPSQMSPAPSHYPAPLP